MSAISLILILVTQFDWEMVEIDQVVCGTASEYSVTDPAISCGDVSYSVTLPCGKPSSVVEIDCEAAATATERANKQAAIDKCFTTCSSKAVSPFFTAAADFDCKIPANFPCPHSMCKKSTANDETSCAPRQNFVFQEGTPTPRSGFCRYTCNYRYQYVFSGSINRVCTGCGAQ